MKKGGSFDTVMKTASVAGPDWWDDDNDDPAKIYSGQQIGHDEP